jgi:hypothetical protein
MRRPGLFQRVNRGAALAVVLGFLVQALVGMPLTLRMIPGLDGIAFCGAAHPAGLPGDPAQLPAGHDHDHCLLCQAGPVPPPTAAFALHVPPGEPVRTVFANRPRRPAPQRPRPAFASRAPPLTA